jgi:NTP pyrophosphatase (non-canonical NTP hydrolase)|nr:MAG TPA: NTP-PPase-like protein [Caudoviricetes sp.]
MNKYDFKDTIKRIDNNNFSKDKLKNNINDNSIKCFNIIYDACKDIADRKTNNEVNMLLVEELSELIKPIIKLERWNWADEFLRCEYSDIRNNIYEELADVIIMLLQFIYKNDVIYKDLVDKISDKLLRFYDTKPNEK